MSGCTPRGLLVRALAPRRRVRRLAHYTLSRRTHLPAARHHVTGHAVPHLPLVRHPRPHPVTVAHKGVCGVSPAKLRLIRRAVLAGAGGLGAGAVGAGAGAALSAGYGWFGVGGAGSGGGVVAGGGAGGGGSGGPGGGPHLTTPGGPVGGPTGGNGPGGVLLNRQPAPPASVPEPPGLLILGSALLVLAVLRLRLRRG